ncbi:hypothetical protein GCM10023219_21420 [Stakelama sediminis]|uniref:Uncharacterized protein n=1 Tax=Stakelama sediminis TaxID=463200 RepID=A0A840Z294_9SPHN|nr:hypothetical protein [Stakelama sediminis]MBB5720013.1 hypothetical protein [Stakelama sediminis]
MSDSKITARRRQEILDHFLRQDANGPENAVPFDPETRTDQRLFEQLREQEVLKQDNRGGFYIDMAAYRRFRKKRRRRTGILVAIAAGALTALLG